MEILMGNSHNDIQSNKYNNRNICNNREYVLNTVTILANGFQNGLRNRITLQDRLSTKL